MERTPRIVIIMCRCATTREPFGIRLELMNGQWTSTWSFLMKESAAAREGYDRTSISGTFVVAPEYPGCPRCRSRGWATCGACTRLGCWNGGSTTHVCPWCGVTSNITGTIQRLDAGRDA